MRSDPRNHLEMADILNTYWDDFVKTHKVSRHHHKVVGAIRNCRTSRMGTHLEKCSNCNCDYETMAYNSCRDRHCPKCSTSKRLKWVSERIKELLPIPYFHTTCTMPPILRPLCLFNQKIIYDLFFKSTSYALNAFSKDKKFLGAQLGFVGILHTWGKSLWYHPHIHYIVTGGGLSGDKWINLPYKYEFLFPSEALSRTIRARFVELLKNAYAEGKLQFPGELSKIGSPLSFKRFCNELGNQAWYCHVKKPFTSPEKVLEYMGRYTHRVAISNSRLISMNNDRVTFRAKDYKEEGKEKVVTLSADTFIQRFLWHVLPSGFRKIRHFGFLNTGFRSEKIQIIRNHFKSLAASIEEQIESWFDRMGTFINHLCPKCHEGRLIFYMNSS